MTTFLGGRPGLSCHWTSSAGRGAGLSRIELEESYSPRDGPWASRSARGRGQRRLLRAQQVRDPGDALGPFLQRELLGELRDHRVEGRGGQAGLVEISLALGTGRTWCRWLRLGRRGTAGAGRRWSPLAKAIEYRRPSAGTAD